MAMSMDSSEFEQAAKFLPTIVGKLESNDLLYFYARFKQAKEGPNNVPKPGFFEFQAKQKWQAWKDLKDLSKEEAQIQYVERLDEIDPNWRGKKVSDTQKGWVTVSTLAIADEDKVADEAKTIFDWVQEGNVSQVEKCLDSKKVDLQSKDDNGLSLVHWAADRGHLQILKILLDHGIDMNTRDEDGQTPLHYASSCGHRELIQLLIQQGADTQIRDNDDQTPLQVANDEETKAAFS